MKFKHLSSSDLERINEIYENKSLSWTERMSILSDEFLVDERTIRRWRAKTVDKSSKARKNGEARVLLFDIETCPLKSYVWGLWNQDISPKNGQLISDWFILSWSAKWLFEEEIMSDKLTGKEVLKEDDSRIAKTLWHLLDEAEIVVGHNVRKFDVRKSNTRFIKHGLPPTSHYKTVDTLKQCRKNFAITSNRLDYVGKFLGVGQKIDTGGFDLWKRCMEGDDDALKQMQVYCDNDVKLLEDVYLKIRPYINPHPNLGLYIGDDVERCPTCASDNIKWEGTYATSVNLYEAFRCQSCGSIGRSRNSTLDPTKRKSLLVPTSR